MIMNRCDLIVTVNKMCCDSITLQTYKFCLRDLGLSHIHTFRLLEKKASITDFAMLRWFWILHWKLCLTSRCIPIYNLYLAKIQKASLCKHIHVIQVSILQNIFMQQFWWNYRYLTVCHGVISSISILYIILGNNGFRYASTHYVLFVLFILSEPSYIR